MVAEKVTHCLRCEKLLKPNEKGPLCDPCDATVKAAAAAGAKKETK